MTSARLAVAPKRRGFSALRVRYWPGVGPWPLLLACGFALPAALSMPHDPSPPCSVVCARTESVQSATPGSGGGVVACGHVSASTPPHLAPATAVKVDVSCSVNDPRVLRSFLSMPCDAIAPALAGLIDVRNPLRRPLVHASVVSAALGHVAPDEPREASSSEVDAVAARRLLLDCADGAAAAAPATRTVEVMVQERNYEASVGVVCALLALVLLLALRTRVSVALDLDAGVLVIVERGFLGERRSAIVKLDTVSQVVVEVGAAGFILGRRVVIVRHDGGRVPLTAGFTPFTFAVHDKAARRLRASVEALAEITRA